jgi:hypothetical protein
MPKPSPLLPALRDLATEPWTGGLKMAVPVPTRTAARSIVQKPPALAIAMYPTIFRENATHMLKR